MDKEVEAENSKLILRLSGDPDKGGNRNNYIELDGDPLKQRVGLGGGLGLAHQWSLGEGYSLIGSGGVEAHIASNLGVSADRAARQHDSRHDAPLGSHAMGAFELRDVLNEVVAKTGGTGDLGKLTVGQAETILNAHPNLVRPSQYADIRKTMDRLEKPYSIPPADLAQAQNAINTFYKDAKATGAADKPINVGTINDALGRTSGTHLSPGAEAIITSAINHAGGTNGSITATQLYNESQTLMPALAKSYIPADYLRPMTLSQVNDAAVKTRDYIAMNGGPDATADKIVSGVNSVLALNPTPSSVAGGAINGGESDPGQIATAINTLLTVNGQPPLSAGAIGSIQHGAEEMTSTLNTYIASNGTRTLSPPESTAIHNGVNVANKDAGTVISTYKDLPSAADVTHYQHIANKVVALDPEAEAKAFLAAGVLTPHLNAAVVGQQGVAVNVGDVDYVAGRGVRIHPDITRSMREEVGIGETPAMSFSPDTARKLNLSLPHEGTSAGMYAFAQQDTDRWGGISGVRKTDELGVGVSVGKALGGNREGILTLEGGREHSSSTIPGDTPRNDKFIAIKGILKF